MPVARLSAPGARRPGPVRGLGRSLSGTPYVAEVNAVWILKTLLFLVFLVAVTYFVMLNGSTWVDVKLMDSGVPQQVHLVFLLFQAFVIGAVVWFFVTVSHEITFRRAIRKLKQENADLLQEIAGLRSISLDDIDTEKPSDER
jgi:uncharacterized integral membrane protein